MVAKVICVVNRKGGVGKTSLSLALADLLAHHDQGQRRENTVLALDLDPQASLTAALLNIPQEYRASAELRSKLVSDRHTITDFMLAWLAGNHDPDGVHGKIKPGVGLPNMHYVMLGNDPRCWEVERQFIVQNRTAEVPNAVAALLAGVQGWNGGSLRYIVVDCPPGFTLLSDAMLRKAHLILCPVVPDLLGFWGMESFEAYLRDLGGDIAKRAFWIANRIVPNPGQQHPQNVLVKYLEDQSVAGDIGPLREAGLGADRVQIPDTRRLADRLTMGVDLRRAPLLHQILGHPLAKALNSFAAAVRYQLDQGGTDHGG